MINLIIFIILLLSYILPIYFCKNLKGEIKTICITFFLSKLLEFFFIFFSFYNFSKKSENEYALLINITYIIIIKIILCIIYILILNKSHKHNENINKLIINKKYYEFHFILIGLVLYISYLISNNFIGLLDPRDAYQNYRKGYGFLWAGYIYFISLWFLIRIVNQKNKTISLIVYMFFMFQSGSKGLLLNSLIPILALENYKKVYKNKLLLISLLFSIIGVLVLFDAFENFSALLIRVESYFDMFNNSSRVFEDYLNYEFEFYYGNIHLSSLWQYVPRIIYPDKPVTWGVSSLVDLYYPGVSERGLPSFGFYTSEFADFGFFGFILVLLSLEQIIIFISLYILTSNCRNNFLRMSSFGVLIMPGFYFHIPVLISILIFYIFLFEKK